MTSLTTRSIIICSCSRLTIEWQTQSMRSIIICLCSRLTSDSCLLHTCSKACSVQWWTQSRDQLLSFDSCLQRVKELVLFMSIAFDKTCSVHWLTQSRDQLLTCLYSRLTSNDELNDEINYYLSLKQTHYSCHSSRLFLFSFKYSMMNEFQLIFSWFQTLVYVQFFWDI